MRGYKKELGNIGEAAAEKYLKKKRYKILARNYYTRFGELDIVARDGETIVFAEVKTRTSKKFGTPGEAVTLKKQSNIINAAQLYLMENEIDECDMRFDVLEVFAEDEMEINHIENAFGGCGY